MTIYNGLLALPPRQTNYETARAMAAERLRGLDFAAQCQKAGVTAGPEGAEINFIDRRYLLHWESLRFQPRDGKAAAELWEEIIILHYLATADGRLAAGELISFQQIPDGAIYYPAFLKRTSGILLPRFGGKPEELGKKAAGLGAKILAGLGDFAVSLPALPRVEVVIVCWRGDREFPPELRILFDKNITGYLPTEDITVLAQMISLKLVR